MRLSTVLCKREQLIQQNTCIVNYILTFSNIKNESIIIIYFTMSYSQIIRSFIQEHIVVNFLSLYKKKYMKIQISFGLLKTS